MPCQIDPDMWFSASEEKKTLAKDLCSSCWFKDKCLDLATSYHEVHGIWGGVDFSDPSERISDEDQLILCRAKRHWRKVGENCKECRRESQARYDKKVKKNYKKKKSKNILGGYCKNDHLLTQDNTSIRSYDQAIICKDCIKNNRRRKYLPVRAYSKPGDFV